MPTDTKTQLYQSIAYFFKREVDAGTHSPEVAESLEVAKQCLESAFGFSTDSLSGLPDLLSLFSANQHPKAPSKVEMNGNGTNMAETLKNQGNQCMKENQFQEAIACYSKAIEISPNNAVYYCNRAAAYSRLDQQQKAIEDCQSALRIEPNYSKAYGRMGIAYSSMGDHAKAVDAYRKGLEIDPQNETCQQNLALAEERLRESNNAMPSAGAGLGGLDFGAILNNPMMQNIACQLMRDPNTQTVMADLFRNTFGATADAPAEGRPRAQAEQTPQQPQQQQQQQQTPPTTQSESQPNNPNASPAMDQFLRLGHQLAQQLRSANPQLVDQLRQTFQNMPPSDASGRSA